MPRLEKTHSRPVRSLIKEWSALNDYELTWIALGVFGVSLIGVFVNR